MKRIIQLFSIFFALVLWIGEARADKPVIRSKKAEAAAPWFIQWPTKDLKKKRDFSSVYAVYPEQAEKAVHLYEEDLHTGKITKTWTAPPLSTWHPEEHDTRIHYARSNGAVQILYADPKGDVYIQDIKNDKSRKRIIERVPAPSEAEVPMMEETDLRLTDDTGLKYQGAYSWADDLVLSPDGRYLALSIFYAEGMTGSSFHVADLKAGKWIYTQPKDYPYEANPGKWSLGADLITVHACYPDAGDCHWEIFSIAERKLFLFSEKGLTTKGEEGLNIESITLSKNGDRALASYKTSIRLYDLKKQTGAPLIKNTWGKSLLFGDVAWTPDEKSVISIEFNEEDPRTKIKHTFVIKYDLGTEKPEVLAEIDLPGQWDWATIHGWTDQEDLILITGYPTRALGILDLKKKDLIFARSALKKGTIISTQSLSSRN